MLNQLKSLGLSEKEAKVYLAMLELGPTTMLQIAAKAEINRPTAYVQIESLKKHGLVSTQTKGKKQLFIAENPEYLQTLLDTEKRVLDSRKEELSKILPELKTLYNIAGEKPLVRFFEGKEGLLKVQKEFLHTKDKLILGISAIDNVLKTFPEREEYVSQRTKKGIRAKLIYTSATGPKSKQVDEGLLLETRFIPPEKFPFSADITIYNQSVAIASLMDKITCTVIEQKAIADSFRGLFNFMWTMSDKI